jgi:hypothetical protein
MLGQHSKGVDLGVIATLHCNKNQDVYNTSLLLQCQRSLQPIATALKI